MGSSTFGFTALGCELADGAVAADEDWDALNGRLEQVGAELVTHGVGGDHGCAYVLCVKETVRRVSPGELLLLGPREIVDPTPISRGAELLGLVLSTVPAWLVGVWEDR